MDQETFSWTSSLGDAYAKPAAGCDGCRTSDAPASSEGPAQLNSNEQEKVTTQGNTIVIQPANPDVVYVPAYDPWLVYGDPIVAYPGWVSCTRNLLWRAHQFTSAGGFGNWLFFGGFGWGLDEEIYVVCKSRRGGSNHNPSGCQAPPKIRRRRPIPNPPPKLN